MNVDMHRQGTSFCAQHCIDLLYPEGISVRVGGSGLTFSGKCMDELLTYFQEM